MIRRVLLISILFVIGYSVLVQFQVDDMRKKAALKNDIPASEEAMHKMYSFAFTKYTAQGEREIEIEGDSANILSDTIDLLNVVAKAYAEETPVTITADKGKYDKKANKIHITENVVATTEDGTRLLTEELDIYPEEHVLETEVETQVKKGNINIDGTGARGDTNLKKVKFKKNVTVVIQDAKESPDSPTIITCDGPLEIDYGKNIAHFQNNVVAEDERGKLTADVMDVYYNKVSRKVSKIVAVGNVVIENSDGNKTYSDNVIYLAEEGRVILGGDTEALYFGGDSSGLGGGLI